MNTIDMETLQFLSERSDIDSISTKSFCPEDIYLNRENLVGLYIKGHGLVLEPKYVSISRIGHILKVGIRNKEFVLYGGYSLVTESFIIPPLYTECGFWNEFKNYRDLNERATHG